MWNLLISRRFAPFFWVQSLGALNDNLYKNGLALFLVYQLSQNAAESRWWINLSAGLFILPFFLFSPLAGELADKLDKGRLIRWVKFNEILVMLLGALGFWLDNTALLLAVIFLMGMQSAFFGPVKYSLIPDVLRPDELPAGNALVETGTFLAILLGTLGASLLAGQDGFKIGLVTAVLLVALLGWLFSLAIPAIAPANPNLCMNWNLFTALQELLGELWHNRRIHLPVLGISWFWFYGAFLLTQLPAWNRWHLGGDESSTGLLLLLFAVGIAIGALLCARLSKKTGLKPLFMLGISGLTLFLLDLGLATPPPEAALLPLQAWWQQPGMPRLLLDLLALSISGGLFIVPLYTLLQQRAEHERLSRMVAGNNVLNALFMVLSALLGLLLPTLGLNIGQGFMLVAVMTLLTGLLLRQLSRGMSD